jgi:hypothetical protein
MWKEWTDIKLLHPLLHGLLGLASLVIGIVVLALQVTQEVHNRFLWITYDIGFTGVISANLTTLDAIDVVSVGKPISRFPPLILLVVIFVSVLLTWMRCGDKVKPDGKDVTKPTPDEAMITMQLVITRQVFYAVESSMVMVIVAAVSGIRALPSILFIAALQLLMCITGYYLETVTMKTPTTNIVLVALGMTGAGLIQWTGIFIAATAAEPVSTSLAIPIIVFIMNCASAFVTLSFAFDPCTIRWTQEYVYHGWNFLTNVVLLGLVYGLPLTVAEASYTQAPTV